MMSQSAVDMKKEKKTAASSLFKKNVKKFMNNKLALLGLLVIVIMDRSLYYRRNCRCRLCHSASSGYEESTGKRISVRNRYYGT